MRHCKVVQPMSFVHVIFERLSTKFAIVPMIGVVMGHVIQTHEYQQVNDEKVGAKYESSQLVGQNESAKAERELVVQLQIGVPLFSSNQI
jgi:hypothetical protein